MGIGKLWTIAVRDLGRNRRRSFFTLLAVALGLALLIGMNGLITGVMEDSLQMNIRLQTGHVQVRSEKYAEDKLSLKWEDLLDNADAVAAKARAVPGVQAAAPVLWANGVLNTANDSLGVRLFGIDPTSELYAPIRSGMQGGEFLAADDRNGIVLGKRLADSLGLQPGQKVSLTAIDADGNPQEAVFTVRGVFTSGAPTYDNSAVFLPLAKAQALTNTAGRASAVVINATRQDEAGAVAAALQGPGLKVLTWQELNKLYIETLAFASNYYAIIDGIVILVVAVVIANTLLMAVFERIREMGILAALGMKGRQIMQMFLMEAAVLGLAGIVLGILIGCAFVYYMATVGIPIGDKAAASVQSFTMGTTMYARFVPSGIAGLSLATLVIILLAALYPAWFAARLEPVQALHNA